MNSKRFDACLEIILRHEGGYVDHPADPGGATNLGITRKTLAAWRGIEPWHALAKSAVRYLDKGEAAEIYKVKYWDQCRAGELCPGLDLAVFDYAVNSGPHRAVRLLQAILGVSQDGLVGPQTLLALKTYRAAHGAVPLIRMYCTRRRAFLKTLAQFETFGKGWMRRVSETEALSLEAAENCSSSNSTERTTTMLDGYKTYIIAAAMIIAGMAQLLGVDLPAFEGQAAGHLIFEALAVIFLRRGVKMQHSAA
ncbi:hypothetical protein GCM10007989_26050 [Devosia pacifica]|uniref:Lysozyme family protein n=1 Tax=Devosia pacifica TaxID=1335967 RepID=A0A918S8S9_9HYPH|nr:glycoside hydrolase family 108 protein [Devosia pacifica]GHA29264.1 hypothetical protein GCM10007989_26050 [Devosia pacifica]